MNTTVYYPSITRNSQGALEPDIWSIKLDNALSVARLCDLGCYRDPWDAYLAALKKIEQGVIPGETEAIPAALVNLAPTRQLTNRH